MRCTGDCLRSGSLLSALIVLLLIVGIALPSFVAAQTTDSAIAQKSIRKSQRPAKDAYIVRFYATGEDKSSSRDKSSGPGPLHIIYSDGTDVEIPKERGDYSDGDQTLTQAAFSDIQLADDRQHIGWRADYMMCSQSYPCSMKLVIYRSGHKPTSIGSSYGVIWGWTFLKGGKQVVVHSGFPHGDDTGAYALHDTETGRELANFSSKDFPNWVQQFRSSNR